MQLIFIGTGSAFTVGNNNYHSNILVKENNEYFLIDCGSDARLALNELGLSYADIHNVYISHLHADHVGGLEWLAFTSHFDKNCQKPNLYICENLLDDLWNKSLAGGLDSIQCDSVGLEYYFNIKKQDKQGSFSWNNLFFQIIQTVHVMSGFQLSDSYGLLLNAHGKKIFITTDTQFVPDKFMPIYESADVIFHDCEISAKKSYVHAHYQELNTLPAAIKNKMWLYHYNGEHLPDAKKDGFQGFVKKGQVFHF